MSDGSELGDSQICQDCEDAEATHVCQMTIGSMPLGPLYVCEDCYPSEQVEA